MEKISKSILTNIFNEEEKQVTQQRIVVVGGTENGLAYGFNIDELKEWLDATEKEWEENQ